MTTQQQDREQMPAEEDMGQLLDQMMGEIKNVRRGDVVEGVVMRADSSDGLFVNIGQKAEAHVPINEMRSINDEIEGLVGGSIIAMVVRPESGDNPAILSVDRAIGEQGWRFLEKAMDAGEVIQGKIAGFNRAARS